MKFSSVLGLATVAAVASAAPWDSHHKHEKRAYKIVTVSETVTVRDGVTLYPTESTGTIVTITVGASSASSTATSLLATEKEAEAAPAADTSSTSVFTPTTSSTTQQAPTTTSSSTTQQETTSQTSSSASSSSTLSSFAQQMLDEHNKKRALHDAPPLEWSDTLAQYAADYVTSSNTCSNFQLKHSGGQYGENLAIGYSFVGTVDAWYDEISSYSFSNAGFSSSTGHFTQVVWKSSTKLGCAYQYCNSEWSNYVVCEYDPAGNVAGEYADNVLSS